MKPRVLVAGVGNVFFGDDAFGVEVVRRLAAHGLPQFVKVSDFGIRGMHLAYEILSGYETVILVDATGRGGEPGTIYLIEPDLAASGGSPDAHSMALQSVFGFMNVLGGPVPRILIVGCEPAATEEGMGLSQPVRAAVDPAIAAIIKLTNEGTSATCALPFPAKS